MRIEGFCALSHASPLHSQNGSITLNRMLKEAPVVHTYTLKRLMKTSLLVLVLFWNTMASLNASVVNAQNALDRKISVALKNVVLKDALNKIAELANVSFVYISSNALDNNKVSLSVRNRKVAEVLKKLLSPHALSYTVIDDRIVIRADTAASLAKTAVDALVKTAPVVHAAGPKLLTDFLSGS